MSVLNRANSNEWTGGGFLAENPEAFGLISYAVLCATEELLIATDGYAPRDGMQPPTFTVGGAGVSGLYDGLYEGLLERTEINDGILRMCFGESEGRQTHPIARYCSALVQALAYQTLSEARIYDVDAFADRLSGRLSEGLGDLRDTMRALVGPRPGSEPFFSVSFSACRLETVGEGMYDLDIFSAGDFSLFLLDRHGMSPLWTKLSELLSEDSDCPLERHHLRLVHSEPFALILLSRSACEPVLSDRRGMAEHPGLLWRHRMRLEAQVVRFFAESPRLSDAAERATRFFEGRHMEGDSASGGFLIAGGSYDSFRSQCQERARRLEDIIALFPMGYDPDHAAEETPREEAERAFVINAFDTRPRLLEKTKEALSQRVKALLKAGGDSDADGDEERDEDLLTYDRVWRVFSVYDNENSDDRKSIKEHDRLIRDLLAEHWLSLRPLLCDSPVPPSQATSYEVALDLKRRISRLTAYRRKQMKQLEKRLSDSLESLRFQEDDWIYGRGGDDSVAAWLRGIGENLARASDDVGLEWQASSECLRGLQSAYTLEREKIFEGDAVSERGTWAQTYQSILAGELPPEQWRAYADAIAEELPTFRELWQMVMTLSFRNRQLYRRIGGRAAERRTLQTVSETEHWQVSCMLGALREDKRWEDCAGIADQGFRNEYKALMRRLQEERELILRQRDAFEIYLDMYQAYESAK